eukprot:14643286-Alexandrium_andersonii.AAC.1
MFHSLSAFGSLNRARPSRTSRAPWQSSGRMPCSCGRGPCGRVSGSSRALPDPPPPLLAVSLGESSTGDRSLDRLRERPAAPPLPAVPTFQPDPHPGGAAPAIHWASRPGIGPWIGSASGPACG